MQTLSWVSVFFLSDEPASYAKPEGPDGLTLHSDESPPTILGEGRAMLEEPSSMEPAHMGEVADRRGSLFTRIQARRNKQGKKAISLIV